MHLQEVKKSTLSLFDDKRCYINETESKPWNGKLSQLLLKIIFYFNKSLFNK